MKIITRLQQHINHFLTSSNSYSFSNLIHPNPIELDQLFNKKNKKQNVQIAKITKSETKTNFKYQKTSTYLGSSQNDLFKMYPGLKHIQKSFNKKSMSDSLKPAGFRHDELDFEVRNNNSIQFTRLLDHTLSKDGCEQIIRAVEDYCDQCRQQQQQKISLSSHLSKVSDPLFSRKQQKLFQKLRLIFQKHLILNQQNAKENSQYIDCLMDYISKINPFSLTLESFEQQHISLEHQMKDNRSFQRKLCGIEFMLKKQMVHEEIPPEIPEKKEADFKDKLQYGLEEALRLRQSQKHSKIVIQKVGGNNLKEFKIKVAPQNFTFKAVQTQISENDIKNSQSQKFAYAYGLPYNVSSQQCQEFIKFIEETQGVKIKSYAMSPYKLFLENGSFQDVIFSIPQNFKEKVPVERLYTDISIDNLTVPQKKKVQMKKGRGKQYFNDIPLDFQPKTLKSVTETLLNKIKRQTYSKFNKSTLVLQFTTPQQKKKLTTSELRLYGLNYKNFKNIKFEQAFSKKVVLVSGIGAGCESSEIQLVLANALQQIGIAIPSVEKCHLTKTYFLVEFQNFVDAFMAVPLLNQIYFQDKFLKAQLHYGPSKVFKNEYSGVSDDSYDILKRKIMETSNRYHLKYLDIQQNKE